MRARKGTGGSNPSPSAFVSAESSGPAERAARPASEQDRRFSACRDGRGRRVPADHRRLLPGDTWPDRQVLLPPGLQPGYAELTAGLVAPETGEVKVRFAVREQFADGWVPLDGMIIR